MGTTLNGYYVAVVDEELSATMLLAVEEGGLLIEMMVVSKLLYSHCNGLLLVNQEIAQAHVRCSETTSHLTLFGSVMTVMTRLINAFSQTN